MHGAKKYAFLAETEDVIMCAVNGPAYVYKISTHILTGRLSPLKPHINSPDRNWNFAHIPRMNRLSMCCVCVKDEAWEPAERVPTLSKRPFSSWSVTTRFRATFSF